MEYIILGNSDLRVSRICLGCMGFGDATKGIHSWTLPEANSREIIKYALDKGINFFDTAMSYQGGSSEIFLGRALHDFSKREDVVVATKFSPRSKEEARNGNTGQQYVEDCLHASLKRLGMDYVDLYILHGWDYHTPIEEIMEGLNTVVKQGKVRYIGISNCYAWQIAKANAIAKQRGWASFISIQGHYNLIFREEEREMIPYCKEENIALTPYSALASGRLAKHPKEQSKRLKEDTYAKGKYDNSKDEDALIIQRVEELAKKKDVSMSEIALGWLLTKVASPIIGATKKQHIDTAISALSVHLTQKEIEYLEALYVPHALVGVMAQQ